MHVIAHALYVCIGKHDETTACSAGRQAFICPEHVFRMYPTLFSAFQEFVCLTGPVCRGCTLLFRVCVRARVWVMLCHRTLHLQRTQVETVWQAFPQISRLSGARQHRASDSFTLMRICANGSDRTSYRHISVSARRRSRVEPCPTACACLCAESVRPLLESRG